MKRFKIAVLALSTLLAVSAFTACGAKDKPTAKTLDEQFNLVSAANPIENPRDLTDMNMELDFLLDMEEITAYRGVASNDGDNAGMTLVVQLPENADDTVFETLQTYADNQVLYWSNYEEFADAKASVEESVMSREGDYIIQVFASNDGADYDTIIAAIEDAQS